MRFICGILRISRRGAVLLSSSCPRACRSRLNVLLGQVRMPWPPSCNYIEGLIKSRLKRHGAELKGERNKAKKRDSHYLSTNITNDWTIIITTSCMLIFISTIIRLLYISRIHTEIPNSSIISPFSCRGSISSLPRSNTLYTTPVRTLLCCMTEIPTRVRPSSCRYSGRSYD
jgi:hypothetical protein